MTHVRLGVIGCGNIATNHIKQFERIPELRLVACADPDQESRNRIAEAYGVEAFADGHELIRCGKLDAVYIGTPHYFHPVYAIDALEQGLHVLTDKPVAVTAKAAQRMIDAADRRPDLVFAAMFQMRTYPIWQQVKQLIDQDQVGPIRRANWTVTDWFRTQSYYDSGQWRATWKGEGGGVLLNQCPHNLDLYTWLVGIPRRVHALVGIGKHHRIEVEDDVTAMFEFDNGATGTFIANTAETPGVNRFEIVGDHATLIVQPRDNRITHLRNSVPVSRTIRESPGNGSNASVETRVIEPQGDKPKSGLIWRNFVDAILGRDSLIAPAHEGIRGLELGNAILMAGLKQQPIDIPIDRDAFEQLLADLIDQLQHQGR